MKFKRAAGSGRQPGLQDLGSVKLNRRHQDLLGLALSHNGGDAATRNRKQMEATELLALSQLAPPGRLLIEQLDLRVDLRALFTLGVKVACRPDPANELQIFERALVGFTYPIEGFQRPLPGYAFFQILLPRNVWLPQVTQPEQALCIAPNVPAGTRTAMLILRLYGALSMQSIQIDVQDPAGVFDPEIAHWWQGNLHRVPLTTTAMLDHAAVCEQQPDNVKGNQA